MDSLLDSLLSMYLAPLGAIAVLFVGAAIMRRI